MQPLMTLFMYAMFALRILPLLLFVVVAILAIRWFMRQERASRDPETVTVRASLGEVLREERERQHMTQEFVAQHVGVSRQAVSKWEQGTSEPSTTNLMKLAALYEVEAAGLLRRVKPDA